MSAAPLRLDTKGVSVHHLMNVFLKQEVCKTTRQYTKSWVPTSWIPFGSFLSRSSNIYQLENLQGPPGIIRRRGANLTCPLDGKPGAAYVHCLEGEDHVGEATHMLSYAWGYSIGDIHRVVEQSQAQQSRGGAQIAPKVDFFAIFGERVKRIGHILAMMAPWKEPTYLTRVLCIFEIYTAHQNGCKVDIVMPFEQKYQLEKDLWEDKRGIDTLYKSLGSTKVQEAKASKEEERKAILEKIESSVGYTAHNNVVNSLLRGWIRLVLLQHVENELKRHDYTLATARFCDTIGYVMAESGDNDTALRLYKTALSIKKNKLGKRHLSTATTHQSIGELLGAMGDLENALSEFSECLAIRHSKLGKEHPATAECHQNIGIVLENQGNWDDALFVYRQCLAIQEKALGKENPETARAYMCIGNILMAKDDPDGALVEYEKGVAIFEAVWGKDHPHTAVYYHDISDAMRRKHNLDGALAILNQCLAIYKSVLGRNHVHTATSYYKIGCVLKDKRDYDGASYNFSKCRDIRESLLGAEHPATLASCRKLDDVLRKKRDHGGATIRLHHDVSGQPG